MKAKPNVLNTLVRSRASATDYFSFISLPNWLVWCYLVYKSSKKKNCGKCATQDSRHKYHVPTRSRLTFPFCRRTFDTFVLEEIYVYVYESMYQKRLCACLWRERARSLLAELASSCPEQIDPGRKSVTWTAQEIWLIFKIKRPVQTLDRGPRSLEGCWAQFSAFF